MFVFQSAQRLRLLHEIMHDAKTERPEGVLTKYQRPYIANTRQAKNEAARFVETMQDELRSAKMFEFVFPNEDRDFAEGNKQVAQAFEQAVYSEAAKLGIKLPEGQIMAFVIEPAEYKQNFIDEYKQATQEHTVGELKAELGKFIYKGLETTKMKQIIEEFVASTSKDEVYTWLDNNFENLNFPIKERGGTAVERTFQEIRNFEEKIEEQPHKITAVKGIVEEPTAIAGFSDEQEYAVMEGPSVGNYESPNEFLEENRKFAKQRVAPKENMELEHGLSEVIFGIKLEFMDEDMARKRARFLFSMPTSYIEEGALVNSEGKVISNNAGVAIYEFTRGRGHLEIYLSAKVFEAPMKLKEVKDNVISYLNQQGIDAQAGYIETIALETGSNMYRVKIEKK